MSGQISLRPVTPDNFKQCIRLKASETGEHKLIASNLYSLAEVAVFKNLFPLTIYLDDQMIGFIMYEYDEQPDDDGFYWIARFMIDYRYQGQGCGLQAMEQFIRYLKRKPKLTKIGLSYFPENVRAKKFYEKLGFKETGEKLFGENVMELTINKDT